MRIESSVTSISWIPSEAVAGMLTKMPFEKGVAHYDDPPPEVLAPGELERLRDADRFRFANDLRAWIEVENGRVVGWGQEGGGVIGSTTMRLAAREVTFAAVPFADLRPEPEVTDTSVRFVQTTGGRTGVPTPRRVKRPPFVKIQAPTAWSTLALTIHADGRSEFEVSGASPFPRHWVYDHEGKLAAKTGFIDFKTWYRGAFGSHTPWGNQDSPALVTQVETALERELSALVMKGGEKPEIRKVAAKKLLVEQGQLGAELYVLLDGVLAVEVDGKGLAQLGPGAIIGERAVLEGGRRTASLRTLTPSKVAVAAADQIDRAALERLSAGHRREERG